MYGLSVCRSRRTSEVETEFDERFGTNPSHGIRGGSHTHIITFINDRSDDELTRVGRVTTDDEAAAFRDVIAEIVMQRY